jgi:anti-sigma regulatory factor (Ser/Thr protein kinase)
MPFGVVGLIEVGRYLTRQQLTPELELPSALEVLTYLERIDFFKHACWLFQFPSPKLPPRQRHETDVLLELTPITGNEDVHYVVERVSTQARLILRQHLGYDDQAVARFAVALSEICQNIVEHSQDRGFVAIQKYFYRQANRNVVIIAVSDLGIGIRRSLISRKALRRRRMTDAQAISQALFHGVSRFEEPGRGHGLIGVRKLVEGWGGVMKIRSGNGIVGVMATEDGIRRIFDPGRPYFPGTQIILVLPEEK